ncbi:MAG: HAMP domain-containing sensor histidine kinase [Deltaproteobacteria bacterium]|nr:HAMP domain-containing sensor histidine kinase [Deltaproteobacteria bacterium]
MKFGIFSRSTAGYLMVLFLLGGSNVYAILKLAQFNTVILKSHIEDNRLIDTEKKLVDSLFSQRRYEQKYLLTADAALFGQYLAAKEDFERLLAGISAFSDLPAYRDSLQRLRTGHQRYRSLVDAEVKLLKENQRYDRGWYNKEKEQASDAILAELKRLEEASREDFYRKTEAVSEAGAAARRMAVISFLMTGLLAILLSLLITRSITKPLVALVKKTREISTGVFQCDLKVSAPPEIVELSEAFTMMCDRLKAVDRLKADFFAMISHELKTPLTTIKEGTSLLLEGVGGTITEKQDKLLTIIATESERLTKLVNSILNLSRMEAGMMNYTFEEKAIGPLIEQVVREIAPYAEAKGIQIVRQAGAEIPFFRMDGERILDVLRNLVGNAIKFTPEGGRVTIAEKRQEDGGLNVSVSDSGPGIAPERRKTIFEKYESSDQKKGTGLGLAIVQHIVTAHGGKIWVESKPGEGSRFIFVLPS